MTIQPATVRAAVRNAGLATLMGAALMMSVTASAQSATIVMRGVVPTVCEASFASAPAANGEGTINLGLMMRKCNDGAGYRIILRTPEGLQGGTVVVGSRRVALSENGETVVIDSDRMDQLITEPAHIKFTGHAAPRAFPVSLQAVPKGQIY